MNFFETLLFIQKAHSGATDKAGVPYWTHPYRVAGYGLDAYPNLTEEELNAYLLHDVVEDTHYTAQDLIDMGFSDETVDAVMLVTKEPKPRKLNYMDWIRFIAESGNNLAIRIKLADIRDNSDPVRIAQLRYKDRGIVGKYVEAEQILRKALR